MKKKFINDHLIKKSFSILVVLCAVTFLFVASGYNVLAFIYAAHDDALFFRSLENILSQGWLGPYDNRTLAKGPMLSIFSAISVTFGVSTRFAETIIYLFAGGSLFFLSRRIGVHYTAAAALFILILCNPHLWSNSGSRYLREILYTSLFLCAFVLTIRGIFILDQQNKKWCAAAAGFFAGCAYLTREEDIWLIVTFATIFVVSIFVNFLRNGVLQTLGSWRLAVKLTLIGGAALICVISPVLLANRMIYGVAVVSEFRSPEFRAAIGALGRVGEIHPSGFIPVPRSSLDAVFDVAPVTESIRAYWPQLAEGWSQHGAYLIPDFPGEVPGGWFSWAFRDAVAAGGFYSSSLDARDFYSQLAMEVNLACDQGRLTCRGKRATLAPELKAERLPELFASSWRALLFTVTMQSDAVTAARSVGDASTLLRWSQLIGPVVTDASSEYFLSGWVANMNGPLSITTVVGSPTQIRDLSSATGNDVVEHFEALGKRGAGAVRFSMTINCLGEGCAFAVTSNDGDTQRILLNKPVSGTLELEEPFAGYLDVVEQRQIAGLSARPLEEFRVAIASRAVKLAQFAVPFLSLTATIGIFAFLGLCRHHERSDWLFVLTISAAVAVIARCAIIGYIDITSWRAVSVGYLGPAYPFMIIYSVVGTTVFLNIVIDMFRKSWPSS